MLPQDDHRIPEEILRSEQKRAAPPSPQHPSAFGLPGLPHDLFQILEKYAPLIVLIISVAVGFNGFTLLLSLSGGQAQASGLAPLSGFVSIVSAVVDVMAFIWMSDQRRIGWYAMVVALMAQILSQALLSGVTSLLFMMIEVVLVAYIALQLRDSYTK